MARNGEFPPCEKTRAGRSLKVSLCGFTIKAAVCSATMRQLSQVLRFKCDLKGTKSRKGDFAQRQPSGAASCRLFPAVVHFILKQAGSQINAAGVPLPPPQRPPSCCLSKGCNERGGANLTCRSGGVPAERRLFTDSCF